MRKVSNEVVRCKMYMMGEEGLGGHGDGYARIENGMRWGDHARVV